ncbi:MAG: EAL domain-containing protein [Pseudomonadota bacterium]
MKLRLRNHSLYTTVALVIVVSVVTVMGTHAASHYYTTKQRLQNQIEQESLRSLNALQSTVSDLVEAYAVNEYNNLILSELERYDAKAIVIKDYNMGEILGQESYISGKLRRTDGTATDYDPDNPAHREVLDSCYYTDSVPLLSSPQKPIGVLTVCVTDTKMMRELKDIVSDGLLNTLSITAVLILLLFATLRRYVLKPVSDIVAIVKAADESGLPATAIPAYHPTELNTLSEAMNHMLDSVRESQRQLKQSELRWKFAVEGSGDGLWDWDIKNRIVYFSPQWKRMLGFDEDEIENRLEEWSSRVHPEDLSSAYDDLRRYLEGESDHYISQHRIRCKNGDYIWILDRGMVVERDADGTPLRMIGTHSDITKQVMHEEELKHSAAHDSLTGLPNRFLFSELIQQAMHHSKRKDTLLALLYIDLDGFKEVNDRYGHEAGDYLLVTMAERMRSMLRSEDVVARLGGDEFAIAVTDLTEESELNILLQRLMHDLRQAVAYQSTQLKVSASIGITFYPQAEEIGPEALLRQADHAMYESKGAGKDQYAYYSVEDDNASREQLRIIEGLRQALARDELELYYQPKVDMPTGEVASFEALLRWNHPEEGLLPPGRFLPYINHSSELMLELGEWVFNTAFRQMNQWQQQGHNIGLSINVSAHELKSDHTSKLLESLLSEFPAISPSRVELEILETNVLEDINSAREVINRWHRLGIQVALDDFGTGYSTLGYLKSLPVDTLKIDRSFVMDMLYDSASFSILEAAMGLARAFRCNVVAEGVESVKHGELLIQLGCRVAQGYGIARPMRADEVGAWCQHYTPPPSWRSTSPLHHKDWTILYAIVEHRHWMRMVEEFIKSPETSTPPELDESQCRFGEWLRTDAINYTENGTTLRRIEKSHSAIHQTAQQLLHDTAAGHYAKDKHTRLSELHNQLLDELNQLI